MNSRPSLPQVFADFLQSLTTKQAAAQQIAANNQSAYSPEKPFLNTLSITKDYVEKLQIAIKQLEKMKQDNLLKAAAELAFSEYEDLIRHLLSKAFIGDIDQPNAANPYADANASYIRLNKNLELLLPIVENLNKVLTNPSDSKALESLTTATNAAQDAVINQERTVASTNRINTSSRWMGALLVTLGVILVITAIPLLLTPVGFLSVGFFLAGFLTIAAGLLHHSQKTRQPAINKSLATEAFKPIITRATHAIGLFASNPSNPASPGNDCQTEERLLPLVTLAPIQN